MQLLLTEESSVLGPPFLFYAITPFKMAYIYSIFYVIFLFVELWLLTHYVL